MHFGIKSVAEVATERRIVVQEKCTGIGASSRRFVQKIVEMTFFRGQCNTGAQKFWAGTKNAVPVPRVLWHAAYRTHRSSGYGYECPTELTEVPGTGMKVLQNFQKFRVLWHGRTELTEVPGRYRNAVPVPRVLWHGRTDLT